MFQLGNIFTLCVPLVLFSIQMAHSKFTIGHLEDQKEKKEEKEEEEEEEEEVNNEQQYQQNEKSFEQEDNENENENENGKESNESEESSEDEEVIRTEISSQRLIKTSSKEFEKQAFNEMKGIKKQLAFQKPILKNNNTPSLKKPGKLLISKIQCESERSPLSPILIRVFFFFKKKNYYFTFFFFYC